MKRATSFLLLLTSPLLLADSTIDGTDKYAYGANLGWLNLEGDGTNGVVTGEQFLSGSAYGANFGWVDFGDASPANGHSYANDSETDFGVNNDGSGNLSGFAYAANLGWINFGWAGPTDPDRPRINLATGEFEGFAYSANAGWINLGAGYLLAATLLCEDGDGDGIADAWEFLHFEDTTTANQNTDYDKDGVLDRDEYLGGSLPKDATSRFHSIQTAPDTPPMKMVTVEFSTSEGRLYQLLAGDTPGSLAESGLGTFAPDAGSTTTKVVTVSGSAKFFQAVAVKPLQP